MIFDSETIRLCTGGVAFALSAVAGGVALGAGMLLHFFKSDEERAVVLATGARPLRFNAWLWCAFSCGAATLFFPNAATEILQEFFPVFAVFFSAMILRTAAGIVRRCVATDSRKKICDAIFSVGSAVAAFCVGLGVGYFSVAAKNFGNDVGANFLDLVEPLPLAGGVLAVVLCALHAAIFLRPKTAELVRFKIEMILPGTFAAAAIFYIAACAFALRGIFGGSGDDALGSTACDVVSAAAGAALVAAGFFLRCRTFKLAFAGTSATIALLVFAAAIR